jgi:hypothetical protein
VRTRHEQFALPIIDNESFNNYDSDLDDVALRHEQFALPIIDNESFDFDSEFEEENEDMYDP